MNNSAILINSEDRTIKEVTYDSWKEIAPYLKCELFTIGSVFPHKQGQDTLFVDDEGLLVPFKGAFAFKSLVFVGNGLLVGAEDYLRDNTKLPNKPLVHTLQEVISGIEWLDFDDVHKLYESLEDLADNGA